MVSIQWSQKSASVCTLTSWILKCALTLNLTGLLRKVRTRLMSFLGFTDTAPFRKILHKFTITGIGQFSSCRNYGNGQAAASKKQVTAKITHSLQEWAAKWSQRNQSFHHNGWEETLNNIFNKAVGDSGGKKQKMATDTELLKLVLKIMCWTMPALFSAPLHAEARKPCITVEQAWKH